MRMTLVKMGKKKKSLTGKIISYFILSIWVLITLIPVIFTILTAFKSDPEISMASFRWLPSSFTYIENFRQAFLMGDWLLYFRNSLLITVITVAGSLLFNSMAGYAFARLKFKGREILFMIILLGMMVSPQSIIIPQFVMMRSVPLAGGNNILGQGGTGLLDTYVALIVPFLAGAFGIFLCRQFYSSFPESLDDAARIDGCGAIRTYFYVFLPLSKTILATLTILKSVATWNDFFYPLIMTQSEKMKTVQLGLQMFRGSSMTHYNYLMAATLITVIPMVIVYACAQKYFVQGIVSSGMKN